VAWALGEADSAHVQLTALRQQPLDRYTGPWFLRKVALVEGARGRLVESARLHRDAAAWSEREGQEETRLGAEALAALLQVMWMGDTTQAMQRLETAIRRTAPRLIEAGNGAVIPGVVRALAAGGRVATAREWLARWDRLQSPLRLPHAAARFGMVAEIAQAEGQWADALRAWQASDIGSCTICAAPGLARAYERLGARDSAIAAWEHFLAVPHYLNRVELDIRSRAEAHHRLAALYEAGGAPDRAITHLQAFAALWKDADPALKGRVDEARAAIRRLQGRTRS
jgi:tetratricopeptide (TPR) repeat protein